MKKLSIKSQIELLEACISEQRSLASELRKIGLGYEALSYRNNLLATTPSLNIKQETYTSLREFDTSSAEIPCVSFFSGCGGLDLGFEQAGFKTVAMVELNKVFCDTLRLNFPDAKVIGPPIYSGNVKHTDEIISELNDAGVKPGFPGVFIGGPPCQSFSIAANQRFSKSGDDFKRVGFNHEDYGTLLFDYIYLIKTFRPRAFLIENVEGLLTIDGGDQVSEACQILSEIGYHVKDPEILNAADYQVPQNRLRTFIIGSMDDCFDYPIKHPYRIGCEAVLTELPPSLPNSETRAHKAESVIRYMELDFGKRDHLGRVDRLNPKLPSKTVIAGGTKGGGRSHLHPYFPRTLSVRECARLQTFPDDFVITGPSARQFTQIGNAVPPILGYKLAQNILKTFKSRVHKSVELIASVG